jgi:hypothetical protein
MINSSVLLKANRSSQLAHGKVSAEQWAMQQAAERGQAVAIRWMLNSVQETITWGHL